MTRTKRQKELAYRVRKWAEAQFEGAKENHLLDGPIFRLGNGLMAEYGKEKNKQIAGDKADADAEQTALELFNRFFNFSNKKLDAPVGWANKLHETLDGLEEFQELVAETSGDVDLSGIATKEMLPHMLKALEDVFDAAEEEQKEKEEGGNGESSVANDNARRKLRKALKKTAEEVGETKELIDSLNENGLTAGVGFTDGGETTRSEALRSIRNNDRLKKLLKLIGRISRISEKKKQQNSSFGRSEIVGIHKGRDIERLTSSSMTMLAVPALRMKFIEEYVNGSLLQYELRGKERVGRGEVIVLVDQSGSMYDKDSIGIATAVAAATSLIAKKERRNTSIKFFQDRLMSKHRFSIEDNVHYANGSKISPFGWVELLTTNYAGGGTNLSRSLSMLLEEGVGKKADILVITDGHVETISEDTAKIVTELKEKSDCQVFSMTINGGKLHPTMEVLCDKTYNLDSNIMDSAECIALI
jgi:uncharacterized protein with von Willebrand factor type A (vWA) domain